jgi:raffinose/stachyose/melibiose transport system substrate-binding protein
VSRAHVALRSFVGSVALAAALVFGVAGSAAQPTQRSGAVTIAMLVNASQKPGYDLLIPNFERVYPNINVNVTYTASNADTYQLETTQLAAGNAPDLLSTTVGCGTPVAVCILAKSGFLAPMVKKPWARRSVPLVTSGEKYGKGLFAFSPLLSPYGIFTNDDRFKQLGLKVPQTFAQLLRVCQKAKDAGTVALLLPGGSVAFVTFLIVNLAVVTVYGKDKHFTEELKAGKVTFDGTPGWHQALQKFIDMNDGGCFEPGVAGAGPASVFPRFAQGQGLMLPSMTSNKGSIDVANPQFALSHHPFPGGTDPNETRTWLSIGAALSVNAHSSAQNQAAAQTFVDFIARPKQNALFATTQGGLTQYEFLKGQIPGFMSDFATVFREHRYVANPVQGWWNANVLLALQQNQIGLITGQRSIDDVLKAMDAAWRQGPS